MAPVLDVLYSPVCEKLPRVEAVARRHGLELRAYNAWALGPQDLPRLPGHVREALFALREGRDGFYAWVSFLDGERLDDLEGRFPLDEAGDPQWELEEELMAVEAQAALLAIQLGARVRVYPLSAGALLKGLKGPGSFCLGWLAPSQPGPGGPGWARIRRERREFLLQLLSDQGACGYVACLEESVLAFLTFFPKSVARRLGYYSSPRPTDPGRTLVVGCLFVPRPLRRLGLAGRLLDRLVADARRRGFTRVEAVAVRDDGGRVFGWHAVHPFLSRGFSLEQDVSFADGYRDMVVMGLDLKPVPGPRPGAGFA
ncbi:MAG: GNAT family N-acetyltransferase [Acetobacteraceae bacterium]|nr:GNAT family N-acetyltransferase [Acetobacteraceae bacterium]